MNNITEKINSIKPLEVGYVVFEDSSESCYYGKDSGGNIVFMLTSEYPNLQPLSQETNSLRLLYNENCIFEIDGELCSKVMHVLICKEVDVEKINAFIRLTRSFAISENTNVDKYFVLRLFSAISSLFEKPVEVSEKQIQGLFAELYFIIYCHSNGCDIAQYWQSEDKMKFDFSLDVKKRIEIKSTLKTNRIHHFRHSQLLSELYDIKIVSIMLQKCDYGISLANLVEQVRIIYFDEYQLLLHIDKLLSGIEDSQIKKICFDPQYLTNNLRIYNADNIPHINAKTPEGVFNIEYDCDMSAVTGLLFDDFKAWVCE